MTIHRLLADDTVDTRLQGLLDSGTLTAKGLDQFQAAASEAERRRAVPQMGHLLANAPLPVVPGHAAPAQGPRPQ